MNSNKYDYKGSILKYEMTTLRVLCILSALFAPLGGYLWKVVYSDTLVKVSYTFAISVIFLGIFVLSYVSDYARRNMLYVFYAPVYIAGIATVDYAYTNGFTEGACLLLVLVVFASSSIFRKPYHMLFFELTMFILVVVSMLLSDKANTNIGVMIAVIAIFGITCFIKLQFKHDIEQEIQKSEERTRLIIKHNPNAIAVFDRELRYVMTSDKYLRDYNLEEKDIIGKQCYQVLPSLRARWEEVYARCIEGSIEREEEEHFIGADGKTEYIRWECRPWLDNKGNIGGIIIYTETISERKKAEDELKYLSYHDRLTGVYNRTFIEEEMLRLDSNKLLPFSIIIGDVNGLKLVNDAFGHRQGDELLKKVAQILKECTREQDKVGRIGGDEFAVVLPGANEAEVLGICNVIRERCKNETSDTIIPSISVGYGTKSKDRHHIEAVFKKAEDRMYKNKLAEGKNVRSSIITTLRKTLEEKTSETAEHNSRVKDLALQLGSALGLAGSDMDDLSLLAILHDIGKVAIPYNILKKQEDLTEEEWKVMRQHCEIGYRIAAAIAETASIANPILYHHENWDGTGYPQGLKADEIPIVSRIVAVVDAYDSIVYGKPYNKAEDKEQAIAEIRRCAGTKFDPNIVEVFLGMLNKERAVS
ncbi:MAG: diguanylate cyclase [Clostridia bacterium]|nr:diguanylate cyclase [Clostridia bacterium]